MQGKATVKNLTVNGASLTTLCTANPVLDYKFYGNLTISSQLFIDHNGISDVPFWKIRIRYSAMIIN